MSRHLNYIFPSANASDVCQGQTTVAAANLVLNGGHANQVINQISIDFRQI